MAKYTKLYPYAMGIDLGTSNSCAAIKIGKQIKVIAAKQGVSKQGKTLASCVSFTENEVLVGDFAKNRLVMAPAETVYQAKRQMGTEKTWTIRGKTYRAEQIAAFILTKLKQSVEAAVQAKVESAVITVPAQFDDLQRKATSDAAKIAGINCLRLINEPTAAALAYDFTELAAAQHILVADLGGGTFDVSILKCEKSVFTVIATGGDTKLGGKDIDDIMIQYTVGEIKRLYQFDATGNHDAMEKIRNAVEQTKIALSSIVSTQLIIPFIGLKNNQPVAVNFPYSRALLENQIAPVTNKLKSAIESTLKDSGLVNNKLDKLLLVGGPMNMPGIVTVIEKLLNLKASTSLNPNNCVAIGAAKQAAVLSGETQTENSGQDILLLDVTPLSLGLAVEGNLFSKIIQKNSHIPIKNVMKYTTAEDNQQSVEIRILQGERPLASDNKVLNTFHLNGIPKMKRGQPIIEVTFQIDASGVLSVAAEQSTTKVQQKVTVLHNKNLSDEQIARMVKDAEDNKAKDQEAYSRVQTMHRARSSVYSLEQLKNNQKNLTQGQLKTVEQHLTELNEAIKAAETSKQTSQLETKLNKVEAFLLEVMKTPNSTPETPTEPQQ